MLSGFSTADVKLSVIIPVYNVACTLDRCVRSVLAQSYADMEVILVDDGSPDSSPRMCDEWSRKDSRIRVIHQENQGLSGARNTGIHASTGIWLTFVDSDDYVAEGSYASLMDVLSRNPQTDILEYSVSGRFCPVTSFYTCSEAYWLETKGYTHAYAWNKIFRRSLFDTVAFPVGKVFEDVYTMPSLLRRARVIGLSNQGTYHYCDNPQGITALSGGVELAMLLDAHLQSGMPMDDAYYLYLLNIQMDVYERTKGGIRLPYRKVRWQNFTGISRIKAWVANVTGVEKMCMLNAIFHRLYR